MQRMNCILDTDIGDAIDDAWALAWIIKSEQLDLKLVVSSCGDCSQLASRADVAAEILEAAGVEIPVCVGVPSFRCMEQHSGSYFTPPAAKRSRLVHDGDTLEEMWRVAQQYGSKEKPVTIICIGAAHNVAAAYRKYGNEFAACVRILGMYGRLLHPDYVAQAEGWPQYSLRDAEGQVVLNDYNSRGGVPNNEASEGEKGKAVAVMLKAPFVAIDLCSVSAVDKAMKHFPPELSQRLRESDDPLVRTILEMDRQYDDKIRELLKADPEYWRGYCHWADADSQFVALWDVAVIGALLQTEGDLPAPSWRPLDVGNAVRVVLEWQEEAKLDCIWHAFIDCLVPTMERCTT